MYIYIYVYTYIYIIYIFPVPSMGIPKNRPQIGDGSFLCPLIQFTIKAKSHLSMGGLNGLSSSSFFV